MGGIFEILKKISMPQRKKIFLVVSLLYIVYTVFPVFSDVSGLPVWLVNLASFVVLFALYPRAYANSVIYWFLAYASILAIYVLLGKPLTIGIGSVQDSKKILIEFAYFLPTLSIFSILFYLKDSKLFKIISFGGLFFLILSFLYLIPLILSGSNMLRDTVSLEMYENIRIVGTPGYSLLHAYVIAIPALLYGTKMSKDWRKWTMLVATLLFVFIIINTYITTSLIISFTVILFSLLFDIKNKAKSFIYMFLVLFAILILNSTGVFLNIFDFLIEFFKGTATQTKMEDFKLIYLTGDVESASNITGRMSLHDKSWMAFTENILIGGTSPVGGHSSLLDRLGGMGLLAFIPFLMIIISQVKMVLRLMKNSEQRIYYYLGIGAAFILLYQKGLFGQEGWLFLMVLMPGLIMTFRNIHMKEMYTQHKKLIKRKYGLDRKQSQFTKIF